MLCPDAAEVCGSSRCVPPVAQTRLLILRLPLLRLGCHASGGGGEVVTMCVVVLVLCTHSSFSVRFMNVPVICVCSTV